MTNEFDFLAGSLRDLALAVPVGLLLFIAIYATSRKYLWVSVIAIILTGLLVNQYSRAQLTQRYSEQWQSAMNGELGQLGQQLENTLEARLVEVNALVAHLREQPTLDAPAYRRFLDNMLAEPELYTNVAAAPELRIEYIYPEAGNEAALGLYYPNVPAQWPMVNRAIQTRQTVLIGPVDLVQGGRGFIIHQAVFLEDDGLWGVVGAVLPLDAILSSSGITALATDYNVQVRSILADGRDGNDVWTSGEPLNDAWVSHYISIPNGLWEISLAPRQRVQLPGPVARTLDILTALLTTIAVVILVILTLWRHRRSIDRENLRLSNWLLDEAQRIGGLGSWQAEPDSHQCRLSPQLQGILQAENPIPVTDWGRLAGENERRELQAALEDLLTGRQRTLETEHWVRTPDGQRRVRHSAAWVEPAHRHHSPVIIGTVLDITQQKKTEKELERLAFIDPLTDTPNRHRFQQDFSYLIHRHQITGQRMALLHIDLDDFKDINDSHGHQVGDAVLRICARRIKTTLPADAQVGRIGGDEFMAVLPGIADEAVVRGTAEYLLRQLSAPISHQGEELLLGASIGIALYPDDASSFDTMYQCADLALYQAKHVGRGQYQFYQQAYYDQFEYRMRLENALHQALSRDEFWLAYQPRYCLESGRVSGVEALLRWNSKTFGHVGPDEFIPVAEQRGLINAIGRWVLERACAEFRELKPFLPIDCHLAVNLSPRQIQATGLAREILDTLTRQGLSPQELELEITETFLVSDYSACAAFMAELSGHGVTFSLDDFGTGYSNLATLTQLPLRTLKIDKGFVMHGSTEDTLPLARTIIQMGHNMNLTVVAEGVEDAATEALLAEMGCDEIQGYYRARPMAKEALLRFLGTMPIAD